VPGDQKLTLSWTPPVNPAVPIASYWIELSNDGGYWFPAYPRNVPGSTTSVVLTGYVSLGDSKSFTNGESYYVRVEAVATQFHTPNGLESAWANSTGLFTPATTPSGLATGNISTGDGQVNFNWTAPTDNGGSAVTNYVGDYSTDNVTWTRGFSVNASTLASSINS
jgi:hypothetical protein